MKGIKVLQANKVIKKESFKVQINPKHLLQTEGSKFIEVDKELVEDLLYNKRIKEKSIDSMIDSSETSEERQKLIEERKLIRKSVTVNKNADGNIKIQIRKSIDIHSDTPQKEENDFSNQTVSSNSATQIENLRKNNTETTEELIESESDNENVTFTRTKKGTSKMVLSDSEDEGRKRVSFTPDQENKPMSSDLTESLADLDTSPLKKQRNDEKVDMIADDTEAATETEMQVETKQNLDLLFSEQEQVTLETGKHKFIELKNAGNMDDCPFDKLTSDEVKELLIKWESEICEGGCLNSYEVKQHMKMNKISYMYASTYLATHYGLNGGIVSDHIRETLSNQGEEAETLPSAKEEQKKKRVKLELTDLRDFHIPGDNWPPLLTADPVALNFTWTLKSSLAGMKPANPKGIDMEEEMAKSIVNRGFVKEDTNQLLTGSQIAKVLEVLLTDKEAGSIEKRLVLQLFHELNTCLKWRQLPKGSLNILLNSHEALQHTIDDILEQLTEIETLDLVSQIATTLDVGNTIFGVLLRHYVSLATEINSVRLMCILQRYANALLLHHGGRRLKFLELENSVNPDRVHEHLVIKLGQIDTPTLKAEQLKVYEQMTELLVTQRVEYESVVLNTKNVKLRLAAASSLVVEDRIKMLNRPLTGNLVTVSKKDLLKQLTDKFPMLWSEIYAASLAEAEQGRRPTLVKLGKIARALAREAIVYLELNWPSTSTEYKVDEKSQQRRISTIYREMILDFLGNHSRYSQTDFLVRDAFKQSELKLLDAIEAANPNIKLRTSELRPMIVSMLDMTLSDVLSEPSGRLSHKFETESEHLIKQLEKVELKLSLKDCREEQWAIHDAVVKWQKKGEHILHMSSAPRTAAHDLEGLYWHPPEDDVLMLRPLIRLKPSGTQLQTQPPLPKNLMSSNPLDHILARISRSEVRSKHLVITYFTASDAAKFRKTESQAVVIGRRAAVDHQETDSIPDGGILAAREQDLLSVRVILASTLLFKMDGETDNAEDHREFYQVGTGEKTRNNTYLSQPVTEHEANLLQNSSPKPLFYVKGFTSDIHVVTAQVRALKQRVDLILWNGEIEETPVLLYLLSRRPFTVNGTFIADFTLKVMMTDEISTATLKILYDGMGFPSDGPTAFIECASYRLWLSKHPVSIYELVPTHVTDTKHHITQLLLSSAHNAVTAIDILRNEPRTTSDKIIDVFTYKFATVRYLMVKWNSPGQALTPTTIKAIAGQENTVIQKVGLPAFTQLTQRNQKLTEHLEEKRKRSMQLNYTPKRGEERIVETQTAPYSNPLLETRLGLLEQIVRNSEPSSLRQLETTQQEMLARMDELTEVSNTVVLAGQSDTAELHSRIERTEKKLDTLTTELATTNQLLNDMLKHLGKPGQTGQAVASSALRTHVVKPGSTTPAATGGPSGSSRRY